MFNIAIPIIPIGFIADTFQTDRLCSDRFHTDTFHTDMFCLGTLKGPSDTLTLAYSTYLFAIQAIYLLALLICEVSC